MTEAEKKAQLIRRLELMDKLAEADKGEVPVSSNEPPANEGALSKAKRYGAKGLSGLATLADYFGGISRAGVANVADAVVPGDIASSDDFVNALKGNGPSTDEYLKRSGVPAGYSLSDALGSSLYSDTGNEWTKFQKGGALDPTMRGAVGFVGDVALDPLTYLSLGASAAAKKGAGAGAKALDLAANPIAKTLEAAGTKTYKSGLKRIDQEAVKFGKEPVSDVLMKHGVTGSAQSIYDKMDALAGGLQSKAKGIIHEADEAGAAVDMRAAMKEAEELIEKWKGSKDPKLQDAVSSLRAQINEYKELNPRAGMTMVEPKKVPTGQLDWTGAPIQKDTFVPIKEILEQGPIAPSQASGFKTSIYEGLPKGAYQESLSKKSPFELRGEKVMAKGLKEGVEQAVEKTTGRGAELAQTNDELGRLLTSADKQQMEAFKEANKNLFTSVDAPLGYFSPIALAAKKGADILKMTGTRTRAGKAMKQLGEKGGGKLDPAARRMFWELMNQEQPNNYVEEQK